MWELPAYLDPYYLFFFDTAISIFKNMASKVVLPAHCMFCLPQSH